MLQSAVGADVDHRTPRRWSRAASSTPDGMAPDPTTILFITLDVQISHDDRRHRDAALLHQPVRRDRSRSTTPSRATSSRSARAGVMPSVFARTRVASGAPFIGSLAQTMIAAVVIAIFALSDNDPVLQLFTWLTNLGALGRDPAAGAGLVRGRRLLPPQPARGVTTWTSRIAPALAGLGLTAVFFLVLCELQPADHGRSGRARRRPLDHPAGDPDRRRDRRTDRRRVAPLAAARRLRADRRDGRGGRRGRAGAGRR